MRIRYALPLVLILAVPLLIQFGPREILKLKTFDALVSPIPETENFVILDISEDDVREAGGWPFPRADLAQIHVDLLNAGAIGVAWVVAFSEPDRFGGDEVFAEALSYAPSVLAAFETETGTTNPKTEGTVIMGPGAEGVRAQAITENVPVLASQALQGIVSARTGADTLVRQMPALMRTEDGWVAALGTQILKAVTGTSTYQIKTTPEGIEAIRVRQLDPIPTDLDGQLWVSWADTKRTTLADMDVAGRFVIVGVTAKGVLPQIATPAGLMYPHHVQAALAETMVSASSGVVVPNVPAFAQGLELFIFLVGLGLVWSALSVFPVAGGALGAFTVMAGTGTVGAYLAGSGFLVDVSWAVLSEFVTATLGFFLKYREQYRLRQQIKKQFEHYLDPRQVKRLQDNPDALKLGGERRDCTFLFTDVRGFTAMSERLEPEQVVLIMNKALTAQASAVMKNGGMVDKYIGDAMMAIFGAPLDMEDHPAAALQCAKDIQQNMKEMNSELSEMGLDPVHIGIGINTGPAIVGNMGSDTRFDYTAIGDAVNLAARLESGTKEAETDILIGPKTAQCVPEEIESLKAMAFKGKAKKVPVFTVKR